MIANWDNSGHYQIKQAFQGFHWGGGVYFKPVNGSSYRLSCVQNLSKLIFTVKYHLNTHDENVRHDTFCLDQSQIQDLYGEVIIFHHG